MCRDERPYKAVTFFCKLQHGAGRIGKADSKSSGQPSDSSSSGARQSSLQSSLLSCWDFTHSFSSRSVQQMLSETPFLCLASVYAQELLDYLKQFDKDGKGALSKEELQEVMRGRIRCGWDLNILRLLGGQRGVPILREINTELMKCGVVDTL